MTPNITAFDFRGDNLQTSTLLMIIQKCDVMTVLFSICKSIKMHR